MTSNMKQTLAAVGLALFAMTGFVGAASAHEYRGDRDRGYHGHHDRGHDHDRGRGHDHDRGYRR